MFNDKKLEHILSFRQNIAVIIKIYYYYYIFVLLCKTSHPVLGGSDPFNAFHKDRQHYSVFSRDPTLK